MFIPADPNRKESRCQWWLPLGNWKSSMRIAPEAATSSTVLAAIGADGREQDTVRRGLGFVVMEDLKRLPMKSDAVNDLANPAIQSIVFSAERCQQALDAGTDPILQCESFEISQHSNNPVDSIRGFLLRMNNVLRMSSDDAANNVTLPDSSPFLALAVKVGLDTNEPNPSVSRMCLILPYKVSSTTELYTAPPMIADYRGLPHYTDGTFPNFAFPAGTTPIPAQSPSLVYADNPVRMAYNQRFLYVWSTTGEFEPLTIWYDQLYGVLYNILAQPTNQVNFLYSSRSPGWHWERFGSVLTTPTVGGVGATAISGLSLAATYQNSYRWVDSYRNRYSPLAPRTNFAMSANNKAEFTGLQYSNATKDTELCCNYDSYQLFGTIGATAAPLQGGTQRFIDFMAARHHRVADRPAMYAAKLASPTAQFFNANLYDTTRDDRADFAVFQDLVFCSDTSIATGLPYSALAEPGNTPQKVLSAIDLQGVTVVASAETPSGNDLGPTAGSQVPRLAASGYVTLRWSCVDTYAPEIFPAVNSYLTKIKVNAPVRLVQSGDFGFLIGDGRVIRIRVVGTLLEIIEILNGFYLVSEGAACDARGTLLMVSRDGLIAIDPPTGTITPITSVDRVIRRLWQDSLDSVQMEFDFSQNTAYLLNPTTGGMVAVFPATEKVIAFEETPYKFLSSLEINGSRRVVFTTATGRFEYSRLWEDETPESSPGYHAIAKDLTDYPVDDRKYDYEVVSATYNGSAPGTVLVVDDVANLGKLLSRDSTVVLTGSPGTLDYYWSGLLLRRVDYGADGTNGGYGTAFRIRAVYRDSSAGNPIRVLLEGDVAADLPAGCRLSVDAVPFGMLFGPLESGPLSSGVQKRVVATVSTVTPWTEGNLPEGVPFFQGGVVDIMDLREIEPQPDTGVWIPPADTSLRASRSTYIPKEGVTYDVDDPATAFGYIEPSAATGTLLCPYVRTYLTTPIFSLREISVRGNISASERSK